MVFNIVWMYDLTARSQVVDGESWQVWLHKEIGGSILKPRRSFGKPDGSIFMFIENLKRRCCCELNVGMFFMQMENHASPKTGVEVGQRNIALGRTKRVLI